MKKNLFVVQSPFQLLSAIEAANYFSQDENTLIVSYSQEVKNNEQIKLVMASYSRWFRVHELPPVKYLFMLGVLQLLKLRQLVGEDYRPTRIFIGEYRSWHMYQYFITLQPEARFLLDDGNATLIMQREYISLKREYNLHGNKERFKKWVLRKALNLQDGINEVTHLFTCFDLCPFNDEQVVIRHDFEFSKLKSERKKVDDSKVLFFGGNLSGAGLLPLDREFDLLRKVIYHYEQLKLRLVYVPHRRESAAKIEHIRSSLKLEIIRFDFPAEIQIISMNVLPRGIAAFYSTVLFTLPKIASFESVEAFCFPTIEMPENFRSVADHVYADCREDSVIKVIEVS